MFWGDYLVIGLVMAAAVFALVRALRQKGGCGSCTACAAAGDTGKAPCAGACSGCPGQKSCAAFTPGQTK